MYHFKFTKLIIPLLCIILLIVLAPGCAGDTEGKPTIILAENNWTSQIVLTEIIEQIVTQQLGYPVDRIKLSASANWPAMEKGEVDIAAEIWLPGRQGEIQPFLDRGKVELAGEIFPGGAGWVMPKFVIDGDPERGIEPIAPDFTSILDLKKEEDGGKGYWKLLESPEKSGLGELVGGSPGWVDDPMDRSIILGYDLPLWRSNQSEAVMMARMIAADKKGEPLLMYIWWPHWIFAEVELVKLEFPDPYYEGCFQGEEVTPVQCGHPGYSINKVITAELKDKAPDVDRLMKNMIISEDEINALMLRVDVNEEDISEVAADWISQNQDQINQWLEG